MFLFIKLINSTSSFLAKTINSTVENLTQTLYKIKHNFYLNLLNNNQITLKFKFYTFFTKSLFLYNYVYLSPYGSNICSKTTPTVIKYPTISPKNIILYTYHFILNPVNQLGYNSSKLLSPKIKFTLYLYLNSFTFYIKNLILKSFSFGFSYIQGFTFLLFIDACLTDDEPL